MGFAAAVLSLLTATAFLVANSAAARTDGAEGDILSMHYTVCSVNGLVHGAVQLAHLARCSLMCR